MIRKFLSGCTSDKIAFRLKSTNPALSRHYSSVKDKFATVTSGNSIHRTSENVSEASMKAQEEAENSSKEALITLGIFNGTITKETHPHIDFDKYKNLLMQNLADPISVEKNCKALKDAHDKSGGLVNNNLYEKMMIYVLFIIISLINATTTFSSYIF